MAHIKESVPLAPVQPSKPLRGPAQKRKKPAHRGRDERGSKQNRGDPGSDSGHVLDEYV